MSDTGTPDTLMQIGQVAARTGLSITTVRHYDEVGLVTPSARSAGGFRLYTAVDVERLLIIRRMKPLGFTLAEMRDLLAALDTVAHEGSSDREREAAAGFLRECLSKTAQSASRLRQHLGYAAELSDLLSASGTSAGD